MSTRALAWLDSRAGQAIALGAIVLAFAISAATAMRHTSTTFDEILLPAAGARGYETGKFDLVLDHPPLLQYVYGLPVALSKPHFPDEQAYQWQYHARYLYAQSFFWNVGNNPERIAFLARLMGVLLGALLIVAVFWAGRRYTDPRTALVAALLIAFVPDVLAHSGISYNDVPLALAVLLATCALDRAVRDPSLSNTVLAALASGLTIGVKFSGIIVAPILFALIFAEALGGRWRDRRWWLLLLRAVPLFTALVYLTLVAVYLGDFGLKDFWFGLRFNLSHAEGGHGAPAVLLGQRSVTGWWYFFPVAFLLKTSAALHLLIVMAFYGLSFALRQTRIATLAAAPLRAFFIAGAGFLASTMTANLNIGFRHALPALPMACILIAAGAMYAVRRTPNLGRVLVFLLLWHTAAPFRAYPYFISYLSEYTGPVEDSYDTLVDSSLDWGQGLLALREYMQQHDIDRVYLSYFGSALPAGYGIRYSPLASFFPLPAFPLAEGEAPPRYVAISGTNLAGNYVQDTFARLRAVRPVAVIARSIWLYEVAPQ